MLLMLGIVCSSIFILSIGELIIKVVRKDTTKNPPVEKTFIFILSIVLILTNTYNYIVRFYFRGIIMIELRKITENNFEECIKLEPKEEQKRYVASNISSLAEAYVALTNNECIPMPYAIYDKDIMVGFIMLSYNEADENDDGNVYWVCRLMIDKGHQGKGYGKKAMAKALELIRTSPYGKATVVSLSYEPENVIARTLYASLGFVETGKIEAGELVTKLAL